MHREHGRRPERGEGIAHQEVAAPQAPARLLARVAGLLTQTLQHVIELPAAGAAHRRQQTQAEASVTGLHLGGERLDHRGQQAIVAADAELRQVTALRRHIAHHQLPIRAQQQIRLLGRLLAGAASGCHHGAAGDQHLARQHRQLIGHLAMDGPARQGHQLLEAAIRVAEDAGVIRVVELGGAAQPRLSRRQPGAPRQGAHQTVVIAHRRKCRRALAGQLPVAQARGQLQHGPLMAHHLGEAGCRSPRHGEHRTLGLPHRRQLGRIAHEDQTRPEGMGAAQGDLQQGAVDH